MAAQLDNVQFVPTLGGTTDWTYSSTSSGYQSPIAANVTSGLPYEVLAKDSSGNWEIARGVCTVTGGVPTFARTNILYNSAGTGTVTPGQSGAGTKISFASPPLVSVVFIKESMIEVDEANSFTAAQQAQARANIGSISFGFNNKLRNSSLSCWFSGSSSLSISTAGGWGADGIFIVPTGAAVTVAQSANGLSTPNSVFSQLITGATSVTDVAVRFVIESYDAAPLAGKNVTFQIPVLNNTGGSITPTITVKHAGSQDVWTSPTTDVSAVSLQPIANGATGVLSYCWAAPAGSINGITITVDFGNNFSTTGKSIQIGGGFDCRATPGQAVGLVSTPPTPEILPAEADARWNERFFETSYENGTVPGTATHTGMVQCGVSVGFPNSVQTTQGQSLMFRTPKRAIPTFTTWDGAGTSGGNSNYLSGAWADASGPNVSITGGISTKVAQFGNARAAGAIAVNVFVQYTADARLAGA